jgi:hypothetical protein
MRVLLSSWPASINTRILRDAVKKSFAAKDWAIRSKNNPEPAKECAKRDNGAIVW